MSPFFIPAAVVVVCGSLIFFQHRHVESLQRKVDQEQLRLHASKTATGTDRSAPTHNAHSGIHDETSSQFTQKLNSPSDQKISVEDLIALFPKDLDQRDPAQGIKIAIEMLHTLKSLSSDELFAVLEETYHHVLNSVESSDRREAITSMLGLVFIILAEQEPKRVLDFIDQHDQLNSREIEAVALSSLALANPAAAETYLADDQSDHRRGQAWAAVIEGWARHDFDQAIKLLEESSGHPQYISPALYRLVLDPDIRSKLQQSLAGTLGESLHQQISTVLLQEALHQSQGFRGMAALADELSFPTPTQRENTLLRLSHSSVNTYPDETIDWLRSELSLVPEHEYLPEVLASWARHDHRAAGEWLAQQESSTAIDNSIATYAKLVTKLNPTAALAWVDTITAASTQETTRRRVLKEWHRHDPTAAKAWLAEKGWSEEKWLEEKEINGAQ